MIIWTSERFYNKKGLKGKAQLEYILEVFHLYVKPEKMGEHELYSMYQKFIKTCIQEEKIPSFTATMRKGKTIQVNLKVSLVLNQGW